MKLVVNHGSESRLGVLDNTHFKPIGRHGAGDDARSKNVPGKLGEDEQRGDDREGKNDFRAKAHSADRLKAARLVVSEMLCEGELLRTAHVAHVSPNKTVALDSMSMGGDSLSVKPIDFRDILFVVAAAGAMILRD